MHVGLTSREHHPSLLLTQVADTILIAVHRSAHTGIQHTLTAERYPSYVSIGYTIVARMPDVLRVGRGWLSPARCLVVFSLPDSCRPRFRWRAADLNILWLHSPIKSCLRPDHLNG